MENVMVMTNDFIVLSELDALEIDGGGFWRNLGYAGATVCCVGAVALTGPISYVATGAAAIWYWYDATR